MIRHGAGNLSIDRWTVILLLGTLAGCAPSQATPPAGKEAKSNESAAQEPAAAQAAPESEATTDAADAAAVAADTKTATADDAGGIKLSGRVVFDGPKPERRPINMTKDPQCIKLHGEGPVLDEDLLIADDGGVKNAFVFIRRGLGYKEYPVPTEPVRLDQKNCMYHPRVQGMRAGQKLLVANGDPLTHNVRSFPILSRPFNFGQPPGSEPRERVFEKAEREIEVQCDIHPWMHAYVFVMDHPFYSVSGDDGAYTIDGLPPGEYTLEVWHEKLGKQRQNITVAEADVGDVNFTFKP